MIVFTHSHLIIENADVVYEINDHQFNCIKDNKEEINQLKHNHIDKNLIKTVFKLRKRNKHQKLYRVITESIMIFFIAILSFSMDFNNIVEKVQSKQLSEKLSNEIIVFKPYAINKNKNYVFSSNHLMLSDEEINQVKNIEHVQDMIWRYDEDATSWHLDIGTYGGDIEYDFIYQIYDQNHNLFKKMSARSMYHSTYDKNHIADQDIMYHFQDDGVYLSQGFVQHYELDPENLRGKSLELELFVPIYYAQGEFMVSWGGTDDIVKPYSTSAVLQKVEIPIGGILKGSSFGVYDISENHIYIEKDIYKKYIDKFKPTKDQIVYVTQVDEETFDYHVNTKPKNKKIYNTINYYEWKPMAYSIYLDSPIYVEEVLNELESLGLAGYTAYADYGSLLSSTQSIQDLLHYISYIGIVLLILFYIIILIVNRDKEKEKDVFFQTIHLSKKDIHKTKLVDSLISVMKNYIIILVIVYILQNITNMLYIGGTSVSYKTLITSLGISLILYGVLPQIIYKVKGKK